MLQNSKYEKGFVLVSIEPPPEEHVASLCQAFLQITDRCSKLDLHLIKISAPCEELQEDQENDTLQALQEMSTSSREIKAGISDHELHLKCVGIHFKNGQLRSSTLPLKQEDFRLIPEAYTIPAPMAEQRSLESFSEPSQFTVWDPEGQQQCSQWSLAPGESQSLLIRFSSEIPGELNKQLRFEIWTPELDAKVITVELHLEGVCDVPRLTLSPLPDNNRLCLGPVLVNHSLDTQLAITNTGLFDINSHLSVLQDPDSQTAFTVSHEDIMLRRGETQEIIVTATPATEDEFKGELVINTEGNPDNTNILLTCTGAKPRLETLPQVIFRMYIFSQIQSRMDASILV